MHSKYAVLSTLFIGLDLGMLLPVAQPAQSVVTQPVMQKTERHLSAFELHSVQGTFDQHALLEQWTIVMFGFTHCPDICPTALSRLAALETHLTTRSTEGTFAYVFVSVDPKRDSTPTLNKYVRYFSHSFMGVTGHPEQLKLLARSLGAQFQVTAKPDNYQVAHSTMLYLIGPEGKLRGRFNIDTDLTELAQQLNGFINQ
ncbi:SCO family protein [Pseudoalteromonas rubra]|uniref:SCO family protein n=1 Tax=Pseudoalteromonas rubra TaxID=43658 RepID=UPI002DBBA437|nr:SCO family protein [Pseudoalteromonas rubra]MEC4087953.1 SCO family protein [Pseudoalteromonas rubra]